MPRFLPGFTPETSGFPNRQAGPGSAPALCGPMRRRRPSSIQAILWKAADKLRGSYPRERTDPAFIALERKVKHLVRVVDGKGESR